MGGRPTQPLPGDGQVAPPRLANCEKGSEGWPVNPYNGGWSVRQTRQPQFTALCIRPWCVEITRAIIKNYYSILYHCKGDLWFGFLRYKGLHWSPTPYSVFVCFLTIIKMATTIDEVILWFLPLWWCSWRFQNALNKTRMRPTLDLLECIVGAHYFQVVVL